MKTNALLLIIVFSILVQTITAQKPILVKEDSVVYASKKYPGFSAVIPEVAFEKTQKEWIRELQLNTKSKAVLENNVIYIFGTYIKDLSPTPLNVYSQLTVKDSDVLLIAGFEVKKDLFIEPANILQADAARLYLKQFAKNQYLDFVKDEVNREENKLNDLKGELNKLQNENSRMHKTIQSNGTLIKELTENIEMVNVRMPGITSEIASENELFLKMEEGAAKEQKAAYIKELEKKKKKFLNENESSKNKIRKAENEIELAKRDIPQNEEEQSKQREKISMQVPVYQKYLNKLNMVKTY